MKDYRLQGHDIHEPLNSEAYRELHRLVSEAEGLVLVSPIYNWGCCAELKRFIEVVGTTPPDGSVRSPFFDKVIAFVNAAGLPHSYMAFSGIATSMMLDFKCVISPYNVYVTDRDWETGSLSQSARKRLSKSMDVFLQLVSLLKARHLYVRLGDLRTLAAKSREVFSATGFLAPVGSVHISRIPFISKFPLD
jgi:NAD(P)H-dependent FMN reductase